MYSMYVALLRNLTGFNDDIFLADAASFTATATDRVDALLDERHLADRYKAGEVVVGAVHEH